MPPIEKAPAYGVAHRLEPNLHRVIAPNPSPMTYWGTNTYILGERDIAIIDPGPQSDEHLSAILAAIPDGGTVSHILVSHAHVDHSPLARDLAKATGAKVFAFGAADAGRSDVMRALAEQGFAGGGEGVDSDFVPDVTLSDGDVLRSRDWTLEVIHTPGHMGNHVCFAWDKRLFCADHVMGWASSLVSPPDGDLTDFMASCRKLRVRAWDVFHPGHGAPITAPAERLDWLITHREGREASILTALRDGPASATALANQLYTDVAPPLLPAAARNVFAHLVDLDGKGLVTAADGVRFESAFALSSG